MGKAGFDAAPDAQLDLRAELESVLRHAEKAASRGDYGIAALALWPTDAGTLVAVGENCMLTESDPTGHAEIAALRRIRAALQGDEHAADRRPRRIVAAPTMVCSLEPCPMCTVAMINAGIRVVVVAGEDAASGALLAGRLTSLPPIWGEIAAARGFEVIDASKDLGPDVARLARRAGELFETSRDEVDEDLARTGVLDDLQVRRAD